LIRQFETSANSDTHLLIVLFLLCRSVHLRQPQSFIRLGMSLGI
jgi:hypothetical protein